MRDAVLLSCHGTVDDLADMPAFLAKIRRGHPAPQAIVDEVSRRYARIGGSPLSRITEEQAKALEARLGVPVAWCARLWRPYPDEVLARLAAAGAERVVSLPLAPQSVHVYHASVREAAKALPGVELALVPAYGLEPALVDAAIECVDEALAQFDEAERAGVVVILSAHSLPKRVVDAGDPYEKDFREMAGAVAARLEARGQSTRVAFQSQGMTGDAWLGPDLPTTFGEIARSGAVNAIVAPIGFVCDHVETLYDLDVEAPDLARAAGLTRLERAPAFNARPRFVDALEAVARRALG
jgi:ferrochelatase